MPHPCSSLAIGALLVLTTSCRSAIPPWGSSPETARRNADNAFAAFAFRFHHVQRDAKFAVARRRLGQYALIPSRLYEDSTIWSVARAQDRMRALYLHASHAADGYTFHSRSAAGYPTQLGDQRHHIQLRSLGGDAFEWYTTVEHAIGPARASEVADAIGAIFTSFEGRPDTALTAETRATFPRTSERLGQLFSLDSVRTARLGDGSTSFTMHGGYRVSKLRATYPDFAAYVQKYIVSSDLRMLVTDRSGGTFFDLRQHDGTWAVRLRARDGTLVPLSGPLRPMPDSLLLHLDASAKFKIFRVGFSRLVGDFTIERGERHVAWAMRWRKEPDWHFPLAVDKLIKSPLRRPFEGRGTELRLAVREDLGAQTVSQRIARTVVRESAIMRWLGGLGATAFGDFEGRTEAEENRFFQELFGALRQDFAAWRP